MTTAISTVGTHDIDPARFRQSLGHYASGLTVVTTLIDNELIGFTCQSFYSVSTEPPLISICVKASSFSLPKIRQAKRFAVNILSAEQAPISDIFAQRGADKWQGIDWIPSPSNCPIISGSLHWLDCELYAEHAAGDHLIVIGKVTAMNDSPTGAKRPLLYYRGQYRQLRGEGLVV